MENVRDVSVEYFAARRREAGTTEQRIKIDRAEVPRADTLVEYAKSKVAAGRGTLLDQQRYQAYLIDTRIRLESDKAGSGTTP